MVSLCRIEGLCSDCHAPVPLKCLEGGQWIYINNQDSVRPILTNNTPKCQSVLHVLAFALCVLAASCFVLIKTTHLKETRTLSQTKYICNIPE